MACAVTIRAEQPADVSIIRDIVLRAYASVPYSDHREHFMIQRLRETDAFLPSLSLLAELGDEAVGHILLTKAWIRNGNADVLTLALAPLSVVPEHQHQGVGRALVDTAHVHAERLGFGTVLLVGSPAYYSKFGYERLSRYPIALPFEAPEQNCMILQLRHGALDEVAGRVHYADGWLEH